MEWNEETRNGSFTVTKGEDEPFVGDDGHPYEIIIHRHEDGSVGCSIHDLETDEYFPEHLREFEQEAKRRWGMEES